MVKLTVKKIDEIVNIWATLLKGQVFYIPTLGPVFTSGGSIKELLRDILNNSQTDGFLPYDKNKRWYKNKKEKILLSSIVIDDNGLCIPVESSFKDRILKIFYYTTDKLNSPAINKIKKIVRELKDV